DERVRIATLAAACRPAVRGWRIAQSKTARRDRPRRTLSLPRCSLPARPGQFAATGWVNTACGQMAAHAHIFRQIRSSGCIVLGDCPTTLKRPDLPATPGY